MAETIYDGPHSPADTERALVDVAAERDQLGKQVEKLLAETTNAAARLDAADAETNFGDDFEHEVRGVSQALKAAADQVRKELEGR
jgi:hypothetical protein